MAMAAVRAAARTTKLAVRPLVVLDGHVYIPRYVVDLESFHDWMESKDSPETGRFCYLNGTLWVDLSTEQLFTHNRCKNKFIKVIDGLANGERGYLFSDGVRLSNTQANLSTEPDVLFVSFGAVDSKRVRLIRGKKSGFTRVEGSPEMVLEIVSDESVEEDTEFLRHLYWDAGITEFWLVDVRGDRAKFDILRRGAKGFTKVRGQAHGWLRSHVFGRSFQLARRADQLGNPDFALSIRE